MTILVISSKRDVHCAPVTDAIESFGYPWVRLNTEDFATNVEMSLVPATLGGSFFVRDSKRRLALTDITAVWYRKPDPINLSHFEIDKAGLDYIESEFGEVLLGLYALLRNVRWINDPFSSRLAHRKFYQLAVAHSVGLITPRTIVSNIKDEVFAFSEQIGGDLAIKSLSSLSVSSHEDNETVQYGLFTRRITRDELLSVNSKIGWMPTSYQEYLHKSYEIRATVIGQKCFACRINSQTTSWGRDDFRMDTDSAVHLSYTLPAALEHQLYQYMDVMGINFGCFDIIRTEAGEYVFLECNPNGQWLWIEERLKLGIPKAIADFLLSSQH